MHRTVPDTGFIETPDVWYRESWYAIASCECRQFEPSEIFELLDLLVIVNEEGYRKLRTVFRRIDTCQHSLFVDFDVECFQEESTIRKTKIQLKYCPHLGLRKISVHLTTCSEKLVIQRNRNALITIIERLH